MTKKNMRIVFSSGLSKLTERNASFDSGVLRVAYTGQNRNNSFISRETFEKCLPSIYNCPIVCNYERASDSIGSHDVELVSDDRGLRLVNVTVPCGVIPESANTWWEMIEDTGGIHEYLCVDVLLWKRQEVYRKLKEDGVTDESMEITVKDGFMKDGVYVIRDFEFTAFCLLGSAKPCFEGASLEVFSMSEFQAQLAEMKRELKEFSLAGRSEAGEAGSKIFEKGGNEALDQKMELIAKYGVKAEELELNIEELSYEELEEALKKFADEDPGAEEEEGSESEVVDDQGDPADPAEEEPEETPVEDDGDDDTIKNAGTKFSMTAQDTTCALIEALDAIGTVETPFGEMPRYMYVDFDFEGMQVFAYDMEDWKLYGFSFSMNGDNVIVDVESKTRKKFAIVDFDEGEQTAAFSRVYDRIVERYQAATGELSQLRQFKKDTEADAERCAKDAVLEKFADLAGNEVFDALAEDNATLTADELEEKCYAIRGRVAQVKFSVSGGNTVKLYVEKRSAKSGPYGDLFDKYGKNPRN